MMKKNNNSLWWPTTFLSLLVLVSATVYAQYNLQVPSNVCAISADTTKCFAATPGKIYTVGKEVSSLSDLYKFCMGVDTISAHKKPVRIILALDNSASMCQENTGCRGAMNNDPTNKRIAAANLFVDSVAATCATCEIGVIQYASNRSISSSQILAPLPLTPANIVTIHNKINAAGCSLNKVVATDGIEGVDKITNTYTGSALDSALRLVDINYAQIANTMDRHIIILTDGDWQIPLPNDIYNRYHGAGGKFPGRPLPTVHGVFLSDSAAHVAAGFPPHGLFSCLKSDSIDLRYLKAASIDSTGGKYFSGTTPQSIAAAFSELFHYLIQTSNQVLQSVSFVNIATRENRQATFVPVPGTASQYIVKVPAFSLSYGTNKFEITKNILSGTGVPETIRDTISIIRSTGSGTSGNLGIFVQKCKIDSAYLSITCNPKSVLPTEYVTVTAKVAPQDTNRFAPNNIIVRAFVPFSDYGATTLALFHLDNTLVNGANGGAMATGAPTFNGVDAAFGACLSAGSFMTTLTQPIAASSDFAIEAWIKPGATNQQGTIVSGSGVSMTLGANGIVTATLGSVTIQSNLAIDKGVWEHVSLARVKGALNLYVNGIPIATEATSSDGITGSLTVGPFTGSLIDEFRVTSAVNYVQILKTTVLQIPQAENIIWKINNVSTTGQTAVLPYSLWQGSPKGQAQFQFSSTNGGGVIVNLFDTTALPSPLLWSKNGEPVIFLSTGIPVTATLRDTSHDGHLDMIDIQWKDISSIRTPLPPPDQFVKELHLVLLNGQLDTLHAASLIADIPNKVIHIILTENKGRRLETGWLRQDSILLTNIPMTIDGKPFLVTQVIDGAAPVISAACFAPALLQLEDSLYITFSEPITTINATIMRVKRDGSQTPFSSLNPKKILSLPPDKLVFLFHNDTISPDEHSVLQTFTTGPSSPKVTIEYCHPVPLIVSTAACQNPFIPQVTIIPEKQRTPGSSVSTGTRIEVLLSKSILGFSSAPQINGYLSIYDAVGNVIIDKTKMISAGTESTKKKKLYFNWSGQTDKGSMVGGGTYIAKIVIEDIASGRKETTKHVIGVKIGK